MHTDRTGFDVRRWDSVVGQEAFCAFDTTLGKRLVVLLGTPYVGMAFESQVGLRLAREILLEITRQGGQDLFLAGKQAPHRTIRSGLGGWEVDAVKGKSQLQRC